MKKDNIRYIFKDQPSKEDLFNLKPYRDALKEIITKCETPMTISVQGDWGSGKTSFVMQTLDALDQDIDTIEFSTWKYSQFVLDDDSLIEILLNDFVDKIIDDNDYKKTAKKTIRLLINSVNLPTIGAINFNDWKKIIENDQTNVDIVQTFEKFQKIIKKSLVKKERVVIFIDDLDRLEPKKVIRILEVIQNILNFENCVFILAVDYEIVIQGFKEKMGDSYSKMKSKNFFDKIVQLPFTLPENTKENSKAYIKKMMKELSISENKLEEFLDIIELSVRFNPRKLKRVMNSYWLLRLTMDTNKMENEDYEVHLFFILCLQLEFEQMYLFIYNNMENEEKLLAIKSTIEMILYDETDTFNNINSEIKDILIEMSKDVEKNLKLLCADIIEFFEKFNNLFIEDNNKKINLSQILLLSGTTSNISNSLKSKGTVGSLVRETVLKVTWTEKEIIEATQKEYAKNNFNQNYPLFIIIDDALENDEEKIDLLRYPIVSSMQNGKNKRHKAPRYYKKPICITTSDSGKEFKVLLTSQWGEIHREKYEKWLNNRML